MKPAALRCVRSFGILLLAAVFVSVSWAVEQTGDIAGRVLDETKTPMPGATVTVRGPALQAERAALSDKEGEFVFKALPPGPYSMEVRAPGYQSFVMEGILVHLGRGTQLELHLTPGAEPQTVEVVGSMPPVDAVRTQTQDTYALEYMETAPISSDDRDFVSVISNSPGTGPGQGTAGTNLNPGEEGEPSIRGSSRGESVYLIDGVDSTDPVTGAPGTRFVFDAIQELQLQTGGFAAEYGHASGGVVSIVTKSGGNDLSGSLDMRFYDQRFIEKGQHSDPGSAVIQHANYEATVGGPVVKDKLWFFVGGSFLRDDLGGQEFESVRSFRGKAYIGKLTWQASPEHNFAVQMSGDPGTIDNVDAGGLTAKEASSRQDQETRLVSAQYQGILGPNVIVHAQLAYDHGTLDLAPQSGDLETIGWIDFSSGRKTRNTTDARSSQRTRDQASASLTWSRPDMWGDHTFKFGFDIQSLRYELDEFAPGGEYDLVAADPFGAVVPLAYNVVHSAGRMENTGLLAGYFAQDEWRIVPKLSLNLGVRYDTYGYDNDAHRRVLSSRLVQPRAGISWDVTGDSRAVIKLTASRFGVPALLGLSRVANTRVNATDLYVNETIAGYYDGKGPTPADVNGDGTIESRAFVQRFGGAGGQVLAHDGKLEATRVVEYTASIESRLGEGTSIGLALVRRDSSDIIDNRYVASRGVFVIDNRPDLGRTYQGAELRFRARWAKAFFNGSYTWSESRGDIDTTSGLSEDFDFPSLSLRRYGWLSGDARHVVQLAGWFELPWRLKLGWDFDWLSGYPWTVVRPAFPYGKEFVTSRGAERLPSIHELDLGLSRGFQLGKAGLKVILSIKNALGTETVTQVNPNQGEAGQPLEWQEPRSYEIGTRIVF